MIRIIVFALINALVWFLLLPALWAVIVVGITSVLAVIASVAVSLYLERRRDTINNTSDNRRNHEY